MRKSAKRLAAAGLAAVMAAALMSGCGKKATPENLFSDMGKNTENIQSASCSLNFTMEMSDGTASLAFVTDMDLEITADPQAFHGKGQVELNAYGMEEAHDLEIYQVREGNEYVSYTLADDVWSRSTQTDGTDDFNMDIAGMGTRAEMYEMAGKLVEVNGKDCFEMAGDIGGDAVSGMLGEDILNTLKGLGLDEETLSEVEIPCIIDVYRDGILPARIFIDMSEIIDTMAGAAGQDITVSTCGIELIYEEYNCVDEIRVPEEAVTAARDGGYGGYGWDGYDYDYNYDHDYDYNYDYDYDHDYGHDYHHEYFPL